MTHTYCLGGYLQPALSIHVNDTDRGEYFLFVLGQTRKWSNGRTSGNDGSKSILVSVINYNLTFLFYVAENIINIIFLRCLGVHILFICCMDIEKKGIFFHFPVYFLIGPF